MDLTRIAARISILCILTHALIFGSLHILERQLSPEGSLISDYLQSGSGWLAMLSFCFFASIWLSLGVALSGVSGSRLPGSRTVGIKHCFCCPLDNYHKILVAQRARRYRATSPLPANICMGLDGRKPKNPSCGKGLRVCP